MASPQAEQVRELIKLQFSSLIQSNPTIAEQRQGFELVMQGTQLPEGTQVETLTVAGVPAEWVSAPEAASDRVLFYLHGGAYTIGSCNTHRGLAARLSAAAGVKVLVLEYRLAPENPFPAAIEDATAAYRWLLQRGIKPEHIAIGGDSAGGGLTLGTLLALREAGEPMPAAAILLSPWTDLTASGESYQSRVELDPMIQVGRINEAVKHYAGDNDLRTPLISPAFADLQGLPPMLIQVGDHEVLLSDSLTVAENARKAGVDVTIEVWPEMWHVFQTLAAMMPEAEQAINQSGKYLHEKLF